MLTTPKSSVILSVKSKWSACPRCGNPHFIKLLPTTTVHDLPAWCKRCRQETIVNIEAPEPEAETSSA